MAEKSSVGGQRSAGRPVSSRRSGRVEEKLQQKIREKEFYEAHQTYRVLYQRYRAQGKEKEARELLYNGALLLLQHGQWSSGSDLGLLLVDHLKENKTPVSDELLEKIGTLFSNFTASGNATSPHMDSSASPDSGAAALFEVVPEVDSREALLRAALKWSNMVAEEDQWKYGHPKLHKMAAGSYWREKQYGKAREHFLYAQQPQEFGNMLVELSTTYGYAGEADLFIAQAVLQLLVLKDRKGGLAVFNTYTRKHPQFKSDNPPYLHHPTLNFVWFLLSACKDGSREVFQCLRVHYSPTINRDTSFHEYLDKIGETFFSPPGQPRPAAGSTPGPAGGPFGLGAGAGGLIEGILNSLSSILPQAAGAGVSAASGGQGSATPPQMNFTVPVSSSSSSGQQTHIHVGTVPMPTFPPGETPRMGAYVGEIPFPFPGFPANVRFGPPQVNIHIGPPRPRNQAPQSNIQRPRAPQPGPAAVPPRINNPPRGNVRFGGPPPLGGNIRFMPPRPGQVQVVGIRMEGVPIQVPAGGMVMGGGIGGPGGPIITPEQQQLYQQHTQQNPGAGSGGSSQNSTPGENHPWNVQTDPQNRPPQPPNDNMELD